MKLSRHKYLSVKPLISVQAGKDEISGGIERKKYYKK